MSCIFLAGWREKRLYIIERTSRERESQGRISSYWEFSLSTLFYKATGAMEARWKKREKYQFPVQSRLQLLFIHYIARCIVWCYMITLHEIEPFPRYIRAICEPIQSRRADSGKRHHFPTPCAAHLPAAASRAMDQKQPPSSSTYSAHYFSAAFFLLFMARPGEHIYIM